MVMVNLRPRASTSRAGRRPQRFSYGPRTGRLCKEFYTTSRPPILIRADPGLERAHGPSRPGEQPRYIKLNERDNVAIVSMIRLPAARACLSPDPARLVRRAQRPRWSISG